MLGEQPLSLVTGKGGVGRSAVTAALARSLSGPSTRILALSMGSGEGLAAHLGLEGIAHEPTDAGGGTWGAAIDPTKALAEYLKLRTGPIPTGLGARVFGGITSTVPGIRDVVVMGKCVHDALRSDWDAVVVDAAPTGQIESVLAAPATIADLIRRGPAHEQALWLQESLSDPQVVALGVVTTSSELAITEAGGFVAAADRLELARPVVTLLNQCLEEPGFSVAPEAAGPAREAALLTLGLLERQRTALDALEDPITLPKVFGAAEPTDVTAALVQELQR